MVIIEGEEVYFDFVSEELILLTAAESSP